MKNFVLLILLSVLLGIAYLIDKDTYELSKPLIEPNSVTQLKLENVFVNLENADKLEPSRVSHILERLFSLNITSSVDYIDFQKQEKTSIEIETKKGKRKIIFRELNPITGAFYIEENEKMYLIEDTFVFQGFYKNDRELFEKRYESLISTLKQSHEKLLKKRIFPNISLSKAKVKNGFNREYSLDFKTMQTIPEALNGVRYKDFSAIRNKLENLSYQDRVTQIPAGTEFAKVIFNEEILFTILKSQDKYYFFHNNEYFEVNEEEAVIFNRSVQEFWDKKIELNLIEELAKSNSQFSIGFEAGEKLNFRLKSTDVFAYEQLEGKKFNSNYLNLLFNVLLNNMPFSEAKYILEDSEARCLGVQLKMGKRSFCFLQKGRDLRVRDEFHNLEYYYQEVLGSDIKIERKYFIIPAS